MRTNERKSKVINEMKLILPSYSVNEGVARATVAAFCSQLDPTAAELGDIKCALSEAVTNCIVHAYKECIGDIYITVTLCEGNVIKIRVRDKGCGIPDVKCAREPLYTTDREGERSGMGFTVMESFTDRLQVSSRVGKGTNVVMYKKLEGRR